MRLIDADDFFNRMNNDTDLCAEMEADGLRTLKKYLDMQPTAYSVDKVIEELEKELEKGNMAIDFGEFRLFEIVNQGGLSDDVCEYENTNDEYCKWKINSVFHETINNPHVAERENIATTKYCPYCGKKIKIVGD